MLESRRLVTRYRKIEVPVSSPPGSLIWPADARRRKVIITGTGFVIFNVGLLQDGTPEITLIAPVAAATSPFSAPLVLCSCDYPDLLRGALYAFAPFASVTVAVVESLEVD